MIYFCPKERNNIHVKRGMEMKTGNTAITRSATLIVAAFAGLAAAFVNADTVPDPATGEFWYLDGRSGYPGSAAASVTAATATVVPQVAGAPVFDSGIGDQATVGYEKEFLSFPRGIFVTFR